MRYLEATEAVTLCSPVSALDMGRNCFIIGLRSGSTYLKPGQAMVSKEDVEGFLDRISAEGASYREVEPGLWIVKPGGELDFAIVVNYTPPVVLMRVKVMSLPTNENDLATLSRRLLELNATDLVHGSYGIEEDSIVMTEALELAHLDYEEFQAAFESISLALASHLRELGTYRQAH